MTDVYQSNFAILAFGINPLVLSYSEHTRLAQNLSAITYQQNEFNIHYSSFTRFFALALPLVSE